MQVSQDVLNAIEQANREGRVTGLDGPVPGASLPTEPEPAFKTVSEKSLMWSVINLAESCGWRWYHVFYSQKSNEGFPDLLLLREARQIVAELKKEGENPTEAQLAWLHAFQLTGCQVFVWRPSDWPAIVEALK